MRMKVLHIGELVKVQEWARSGGNIQIKGQKAGGGVITEGTSSSGLRDRWGRSR